MGKKIITIKDVKRGMLLCEPSCVYPKNEVQEVVDIKYNPRAGAPVKDMWGGVVWSEPFAQIITVGKTTGERRGYSVQSQDSELQDWIHFIDKEQDRINAIYADRRQWLMYHTRRMLKDANLSRYYEDMVKLPSQFNKDKEAKELISLLNRMNEIVKDAKIS